MRPMPMLEVEEMPTDGLLPYAHNAKIHTDGQVSQIANSISEFGFNDPVAVWDGPAGTEIVEGHGRVLAAQRLGMETVPVIRLDHMTDGQRRAYTHVHNQLTMATGWDEAELEADLARLDAYDFADFGFGAGEAEALFGESGGGGRADEVPEVDESAEPTAERGQVWRLGAHRLMCGDSTKPEDVSALMGGVQADLLLTDPPYNVALGQHDRPSENRQLHRRTDGLVIENDAWDDDGAFVGFLESAFRAGMAAMKPGAAFYVWHADSQRGNFLEACRRADMGVRECLVWAKNTFALGRQDYQWRHEPCLYGWKAGAAHRWYSDRSQTTVLEFDKPARSAEHPTMKPVALFEYQMGNSTKKGDAVLDLFGGSGTTLIAAEELGRRAFLMELDPHYCDVIIHRWEELTGGKAELLP